MADRITATIGGVNIVISADDLAGYLARETVFSVEVITGAVALYLEDCSAEPPGSSTNAAA